MPRLKKQRKEVTEPFGIRWKPSEREVIERNAKKYTGGNITEWLIYAGMHMVPPKKDLSASEEAREEREQTQEV